MALSSAEYQLYLLTHLELLLYVGKMEKMLEASATLENFIELNMQEKAQFRQRLVKKPAYAKKFLKEREQELSPEQKELLQGFSHMVQGKFIILKELTHHAVFIGFGTDKVYAVQPLGSRFSEILYLPVLVDAVLLPFKDKIIYDGFLLSNNVYFGPGLRADLLELYKEAKKEKKIIRSL